MLHQSCKQMSLGIFVALLLAAPVGAVPTFKVSNYGGGHQIWFEAEDSDERSPDTAQYSPVVDQAGAFGKAVSRTGDAGGRIMWTFDISAAGGKGGTWYFLGRVLNPNNRSDYLLVEGDPGDADIPSTPPFPGGNEVAPFLNADDQIFEQTVASWDWVRTNHSNGHTKQLQDGKNTMYIFRREGQNATVFWDVFVWADDPDYRPTDDDYRNAQVYRPGKAADPSPTGADVPLDTALSWTAGAFAGRHDVYFGTDEVAVSQATTTADPAGVYKGRLDGTTYTPSLAFGQTYYWRVDEVNKTPDNAIFTGNVWSFTAEPYAYPIKPVAATASSTQAEMGPEKTIDGSGMTGDLHGTDGKTMWLSAGTLPNWIQYEFDQVYKLGSLQVWNSNQMVESFVGFGARKVTIETSTDGTTWTAVADVPEFAQALAAPDYAANTTVNLGGVEAKYVKLTIEINWGGLAPQAGLAEVRFSHVPVQARAPQPASAAKEVGVNASLNWRPGRQAASHTVYFGTDANAVANGTVAAQTVTDHSLTPDPLTFGATYYWRVDEVNTVTYPGGVWSFTTQEYAAVDDFESYNDDLEAKTTIFDTWIDGLTNGLSGSVVGNATAPFAERTITHGGKQAMPLDYNNTKSPYYSEAERTFGTPQDWTLNGADTLIVWFRGNPAAFAEAAGTITMSGGGADIWNTADQFRFAFKSLNGDGTIVAKVDSIVNTDPWAKVGVMIRETLDPGSRFAAVYATPGNGVRYQARLVNAGSAVSDTSVATPEQIALRAPVWIKIERTGGNFNGFYSTDGVKWTSMSWNPQAINMSAGVYIGLAVSSHNVNAATTAQFSNVSTMGAVTGAWRAEAIGVAQPANSPAPLYVAVQDSSGKTRRITHPDPAATTLATWQPWRIPLSELSSAGVKITAVKKMAIGVGDRTSPKPDGAGRIYIDDIGIGHPAAANP